MATNKNWKDIEWEFKEKFCGTTTKFYLEDYLNFFKPYFQEEMHDKAVEELEKMDAFMKTYDVDNVSK